MGRRLTRKEIKKKDPVTEALEGFWSYIVDNQKNLIIFALVILIVIGGVMVFSNLSEKQSVSTAADLKKASEIYWRTALNLPDPARSTAEVVPPDSATEESPSETIKKLADDYSASDLSGKLINYYAGITMRDTNQLTDAEDSLKRLDEQKELREFDEVISMALAETYRKQNKYDQALELYDQLLSTADLTFPYEMVYISKSICQEEAGRLQEAYDLMIEVEQSFEDRRAENPSWGSPMETEVKSRKQILKVKLMSQDLTAS